MLFVTVVVASFLSLSWELLITSEHEMRRKAGNITGAGLCCVCFCLISAVSRFAVVCRIQPKSSQLSCSSLFVHKHTYKIFYI
jgi:hypothetical protein